MPKHTTARRLPRPGDTVFVMDRNRRVYARDEQGRPYGNPLYREYWVPRTVASETRLSLILDNGVKIKKADPGTGICLNEDELNDEMWLHEYRYTVERAVARLTDAKALKQIAVLAGLTLPDTVSE